MKTQNQIYIQEAISIIKKTKSIEYAKAYSYRLKD